MAIPPKVFISYAHDTEQFADQVLDFSNKLRENYIDATIDQYEECPPQGWPRWMDEQIENSDFVIIICTEKYYYNITKHKNNVGKGVNWEINIIYQHLYDNCCNNQKFIPIIFNNYKTGNILKPLKSSTIYYTNKEKDFKKLCNRLKGIKNTVKPELGTSIKQEKLEFKERKSIVYTSLIDTPIWNLTKWSGISYLHDPKEINPLIIGLTFCNQKSGEKIFEQWKKICDDDYFDDLQISIIEGKNNNVCGYFVHITTNLERCVNRVEKQGFNINGTLYIIESRYQFMETNKFTNENLNILKKQFELLNEYYIAPACFKNGKPSTDINNISVNQKLIIKMNKIKFLKTEDLTENDLEYVVIKFPNK